MDARTPKGLSRTDRPNPGRPASLVIALPLARAIARLALSMMPDVFVNMLKTSKAELGQNGKGSALAYPEEDITLCDVTSCDVSWRSTWSHDET